MLNKVVWCKILGHKSRPVCHMADKGYGYVTEFYYECKRCDKKQHIKKVMNK